MYARYGLEPIADPSADDALRAALSKLKGNQLIGVINSIGKRRDAKASPALASMIYGSDVDVARAAAAALGSIGGPSSVKDAAGRPRKDEWHDENGRRRCLPGLRRASSGGGKRDEALALYTSLSAPDMPKPVRLAAMHGIIREETSINRR